MAADSRVLLADHLRRPPVVGVAAESVVVISIKPQYAELIGRGEKRVEFRRRFPRGFSGGRAIFYVSSPVRAIGLVARVASVARAGPGELWRRFGAGGGVTRGAFDDYFSGAAEGVALVLEDVRALRRAVGLEDARLRAVGFRPPQSSVMVGADSGVVGIVDRARTVGVQRGLWR